MEIIGKYKILKGNIGFHITLKNQSKKNILTWYFLKILRPKNYGFNPDTGSWPDGMEPVTFRYIFG